MRLICPNCGAQYEVPRDAIPDAGRDVQCSNCGHAWFETPGASEALEDGQVAPAPQAMRSDVQVNDGQTARSEPERDRREDETAAAAPDAAQPAAPLTSRGQSEDTIRTTAEPGEEAIKDAPSNTGISDEISARVSSEKSANVEAKSAETADQSGKDEAASPSPRALDPAVADILRQEVEYERSARAAEAQPLETQPELGIDQVGDGKDFFGDLDDDLSSYVSSQPEKNDEAAHKSALPREGKIPAADSDHDDLAVNPSKEPAARRDLLPDVEVINSSLQPVQADDADDDVEPDETLGRRGFARGFFLVLLLVAILLALYVFSDEIRAAVPALDAPIAAYVNWVDGIRLWLNQSTESWFQSPE